MLSQLRGWEWLIIVALIMLLFGAKRLPDAARGLGRSMRIFKAETKGLVGDESKEAPAETDSPPALTTGTLSVDGVITTSPEAAERIDR
jgi:sec-independent protein translocase protein TatA